LISEEFADFIGKNEMLRYYESKGSRIMFLDELPM